MRRHHDVQPIDEGWRDYALNVIVHHWAEGHDRGDATARFRLLQERCPAIEWGLGAGGTQVLGVANKLVVDGYEGLRAHAKDLGDRLETLLPKNAWVQIVYQPRKLPPQPQAFMFSLRGREDGDDS